MSIALNFLLYNQCTIGMGMIFVLMNATIRFPAGPSHGNRPRSIYQYSNMAPRLTRQVSIFGVAFLVAFGKSLLGIER